MKPWGSKASASASSKISSLLAKTRKIVPSAIPAASAICLVVVSLPCSSSNGSTASTMARLRSSGGIGVARVRMLSSVR